MENETDEQFEERVLNKRAAQMFLSVRARLQKQDSIQLSDMTYRNNRKQVILRLSIQIDVKLSYHLFKRCYLIFSFLFWFALFRLHKNSIRYWY